MLERADTSIRWHDILAVAALSVLVAILPLISNPDAYYRDDMQAQYMPTFYAIGQSLRAGDWPALTLQSWFGGNLIGEYQYALLNPVALALYIALPSFSTLAGGAAFLAICFYAIFATGSFRLCRNLGISRMLSFVGALAITANNFVFYWYASSWIPGLMSLAFMVWAMAYLLRADDRWPFFGAGIATALTATAGWPHTLIALGLFVGVLAAIRLLHREWRSATLLVAAAALGLFMALPAIVPLLTQSSVANRTIDIYNNGFMVPDFGDVLSITNPIHRGRMLSYHGYNRFLVPVFYAAWFIFPLACLVEWRNVNWKSPSLCAVLTAGAVALLMTRGPEHFGPLRYPIRHLPLFQISLILATLLIFTQSGFARPTRRRVFILFLSLALTAMVSWQGHPQSFKESLIPLAVITAGAISLFIVRSEAYFATTLAVVTVILCIYMRQVIPHNEMVADWRFLKSPHRTDSLSMVPDKFEFHIIGPGDANDASRFDDFLFGQMPLALGKATVNGYSPIGHRGLAARFCLGVYGSTCPDVGKRLFESDPKTGVPYLELMRVDRLVVARGPHLDNIQSISPEPWRRIEDRRLTANFGRLLPNVALPGSLSWPIHGLDVSAPSPASATREALNITRRDRGTTTLVFARTSWPGYRATFNGADIPVKPLADFLVSVDLPDNASTGELVLTFRPLGFRTAIAAAILSLLLLIAVTLFGGRFFARNEIT